LYIHRLTAHRRLCSGKQGPSRSRSTWCRASAGLAWTRPPTSHRRIQDWSCPCDPCCSSLTVRRLRGGSACSLR